MPIEFAILSSILDLWVSDMVFHPLNPDIDLKAFKKQEWVGTVYGKDLKEELPPNAPKA